MSLIHINFGRRGSDEYLATRLWPAVPRPGETVRLTEVDPVEWRVGSVCWGSVVRGDGSVIREGVHVVVTLEPANDA